MIEVSNFLQHIGTISISYFWFPLAIWTIIALPVAYILRSSSSIPPVYQYHSRLALLLALPVSIVGSYLAEFIGKMSAPSETVTAKLIVIQNPLTVSATKTEPTLWSSFADPLFWIGAIGLTAALGTVYLLLRMTGNYIQLQKIGRNLQFKDLNSFGEIDLFANGKERRLNPLVALSDQTHIPFTYGWLNTKIVLPASLKGNPDKIAMALRHELMHIKHNDFLLNGLLRFVKALFWFHPLTNYLYRSSREFREITCDGQVLADKQFSKKRYAALLFELAEREYNNSQLAMSMAVNPSSLKKRIQIMSEQNISPSTFRSSFLLTFFAASLVVLTISCSDISDEDGITNTEFQEAQAQMTKQPNNNIPLYIINGEQMNSTETNTYKLARIKSKYIKSVNVFKGQKAIDKYGQAGNHGAIEIQFVDGIDKETVYSDLKEKPNEGSVVPPPPPEPKEDYYIAVEKMPELVGGLESLASKINYPEEAAQKGIEGRVTIQFVVSEQGNVEDPQIIRGVSESLDQEALRVVKQAKFKPGTQRGKPVRVQYSLPIAFKLPAEDTENGS